MCPKKIHDTESGWKLWNAMAFHSKLKNELRNIMKKMFNAVHELGLVEESARVDFFNLSAAPKKKKALRSATPCITIGSSFNSRRPTC